MERSVFRKSSLKRIAGNIRRYIYLFICLCAYKVLGIMLFLDSVLTSEAIWVFNVLAPAQMVLFGVCTVIALAYSVSFRKLGFKNRGWYLALITMCFMLGLFLLMFANFGNLENEWAGAFKLLGLLLSAEGIMGFHFELGAVLGNLGMTSTLELEVASVPFIAVIYFGISFVADGAAIWICAFVLVAVMALSYRRALRTAPLEAREDEESELLIPHRFIATSATQGVAIGLVVAYFAFSQNFNTAWNSLSYILAALLVVATIAVFRMDFNKTVYQIGFPLVGVGMVLAATLSGQLCAIGFVLQITGFIYLDLILWALGSYLIRNCNQPAMWISTCPTTSLMAGRTIGMLAGLFLFHSIPSASGTDAIFLVAAFLVILASLFMSSSRNMYTGWGFVRPGSLGEDAKLERTCQIIAKDTGLTKREVDILQHIASGEARSTMAKNLYISKNTVKTHLRSIYRKLSVHSEAELKEYIRAQRKMYTLNPDEESIFEDER